MGRLVNQESSTLVKGHPFFEDIVVGNLCLHWTVIDTMLQTPFGEDRSDPADARSVEHRAAGYAGGHAADNDPLRSGVHAGDGVLVHPHPAGRAHQGVPGAQIRNYPSRADGRDHPQPASG